MFAFIGSTQGSGIKWPNYAKSVGAGQRRNQAAGPLARRGRRWGSIGAFGRVRHMSRQAAPPGADATPRAPVSPAPAFGSSYRAYALGLLTFVYVLNFVDRQIVVSAPNVDQLVRHCVGGKRRGLAYVWSAAQAGRICARFFFEKQGGLTEDPGTGSACANLGGWFLAQGATLPLAFTVEQGDHLGRACRLGLAVDTDARIFVSGRVIEIGRGVVAL
jgi:hypothetical protein